MGLMVGERGHTTWVKRWTAVGIACCDVHPSIVICVLLSMRVRVGRSWNGWKITSATAMYVVNMPLTACFDLCDFLNRACVEPISPDGPMEHGSFGRGSTRRGPPASAGPRSGRYPTVYLVPIPGSELQLRSVCARSPV